MLKQPRSNKQPKPNPKVMLLTAVIHKEGHWYVAECPEAVTVSQGKTIETALTNLKEATELYLEEFPEIMLS